MAIVWPCPLAVDGYAAAARDLGFPRPDCPSCAGPLVFWPGYRRYVREAGQYWKIFLLRPWGKTPRRHSGASTIGIFRRDFYSELQGQ